MASTPAPGDGHTDAQPPPAPAVEQDPPSPPPPSDDTPPPESTTSSHELPPPPTQEETPVTGPLDPPLPDPLPAASAPLPPPPPPSDDAPPVRTIRPRPRPRVAPKGILKPPTVPVSRFSLGRDILNRFNTRLVASTAAYTSSTSTPTQPAEALKSIATAPAAAAAAAAGSFWGSALKRLSVVTAPAARDLSEDPPTPSTAPPSTPSDTLKPALTSSPPPLHDTAPPHAPHMPPARTQPLVSPVAGSPYATIRASAPAVAPTNPPAPPPLAVGELKRVRFRMDALKVVYPINGPNGPLAPWEEGRTRQRVNTEYRAMRQRSQEGGESKGWTGDDLGRLYAECCRTREEPGIDRVRRAFRDNPRTPPKVLDLSNELLSVGAVEALSDVLSVDFGLKKLVLESCGIDDDSLKPLLHALLVSGSLPTLSLAGNKRIRSKGWKLVAVFVRKARFLRYLDLSDTTIDKRAADYLVQALTPTVVPSVSAPSPSASSPPPLPSNAIDEPLPPSTVTDTSEASSPSSYLPPSSATFVEPSKSPEEAFGQGITAQEPPPPAPPPPPHDEPLYFDEIADDATEPLFTVAPLLRENLADTGTVLSLRLENCGLKNQALEALAHGVRASSLKHISIRRNRINALGAVAVAIMIRDYPVASDHLHDTSTSMLWSSSTASSPPAPESAALPSAGFEPGNTVTARQALQAPYVRRSVPAPVVEMATTKEEDGERAETGEVEGGASSAVATEREAWVNSEARNKLKKQIDELPRTGSLLTLDVKGNDIRNGVTYISQVLKRNRTLKVLNLSENKIDVQGLVWIAEALKYNSTLETLDMSLNPCCGPGLEGISALRAAITISSNLKRVFLNSTDLTSEGAIALAEFLPEAHNLIHLDLTGNFDIDIAGVMALSVSVKMNTTLRCLDLNIPANDPDFARLSQEILQCCVRNTEIAQEESIARGQKVSIAAPILKSAVARDLKTRQEAEERRSRGRAEAAKSNDEILTAAEQCQAVLNDLLVADEEAMAKGIIVSPSEVVRDLLVQAQLAEAQLAEAVAATRSGDQKHRAMRLGDQLSASLDRAKALYDRASIAPAALAPSSTDPPSTPQRPNGNLVVLPPSPMSTNDQLSSPSFNIADSDESDEDGSDEVALSSTPSRSATTPRISIPSDESLGSGTGSPKSPMESQSRSFTLEEGEVFRKGTALGAADLDEELGDVSGEELKKEILEAEVQRSPRPSFNAGEERPTGTMLTGPALE